MEFVLFGTNAIGIPDDDKLIALGHPIGASGARVLISLIYEMRRRNAKNGLATLCIGGGQGIAMIVSQS